jgi:hypothetical protein
MGWTNSHLYKLRVGDVGWSTSYPDADWSGDFLNARKARLNDILENIGTKIELDAAMVEEAGEAVPVCLRP